MLKPNRGRGTALSVVVLVLLFGATCKKHQTPPPKAKPVPPTRTGFAGLPNTPAGHAADATLQSAGVMGPGAADTYQKSLQQLRAFGPDAVSALVAGYRAARPNDYSTRKLTAEVLAELERPEALPALTEIARTPMPKTQRVPDESLSPFGEESVIRMVAIRGIGFFASTDAGAQETLLGLLASEAAPVRQEAARALWSASALMVDESRRRVIRERVPPELRVDPERKLGPVSPPNANRTLLPRSAKRPS